MKIVLWTGNEPNQRALAARIQERFGVAGLVIESPERKRKPTPGKIIEKIYSKFFLSMLREAWFGMLNFYNARYPGFPSTQTLRVENINDPGVLEFTRNLQPDLVVVSGTRLIKKNMFALNPAIGIINLHTGISPYVKGGPNCTNWCIANGDFHLIGNTIMWLDEGIDSGDILSTEFTPLSGKESFSELHIAVMEHGHDLYLRAIEHLSTGGRKRVKQKEVARGRTYYNREWNLAQQKKLKKQFVHYSHFMQPELLSEKRKQVQVFPL